MSIGESIQKYRKELNLSQEELAQQLHISRQTISLWEKNQTTPTIDNLIRLKEIFGISVDQILGVKSDNNHTDSLPKESFRFQFSPEQISEISQFQRKSIFRKRLRIDALVFPLLFLLFAVLSPIALFVLIFIIYPSACFIRFLKHRKHLRSIMERLSHSTYEYNIFENHLTVHIYRDGQIVRMCRFGFDEIENRHQTNNLVFLQLSGQLYGIPKYYLSENSHLIFCTKDSSKQKKITPKGWKITANILFVASLISVVGAIFTFAYTSVTNHMFTENMQVFFWFTPIPIASIIWGFVSKRKGYRCLKNIIAGFIVLFFLCLYGSFSFIFSDIYSHSPEPILYTEQVIGIDIPEHELISTLNYTQGTQSFPRGYIYYASDVYFDDENAKILENQLSEDNRWLSSLSSDIIGIISPLAESGQYDYILIYNLITRDLNTLPDTDGTYRFLNIVYDSETNYMRIIEYDIEYTQ